MMGRIGWVAISHSYSQQTSLIGLNLNICEFAGRLTVNNGSYWVVASGTCIIFRQESLDQTQGLKGCNSKYKLITWETHSS